MTDTRASTGGRKGLAARIAAPVVLVIVAVLFGLWFAYVKAPSPAEVCDHIVAVTVAESRTSGMSVESEAAVIEQIRSGCITHKLDKIRLRGRIQWARYAKCVLAHDDVVGVTSC